MKSKGKGKSARKQEDESIGDEPESAKRPADDDDEPESEEGQMWLAFVEGFLNKCVDADARMCLGAALAFTIEGVERGGRECARFVRQMRRGLERIFQWSDQHDVCFKLFELGLTGYTSSDEAVSRTVAPALKEAERERAKARGMEELIKEGKPLPPIQKPGRKRAKR